MAFKRRMAGAELAAHPLTDVGQQLNEARGALRRAMVAANPEVMGTGQVPYDSSFDAPNFNEVINVKGHEIGLHARPGRVNLGMVEQLGPVEKRQMGDKATYDILAANPPTVEYGLTWDVDGGYSESGLEGREAIAVGRATSKKWQEIIAKMPENALVTNSPLGANDGDFKRADAYMASGFGPVQVDGNQYGIVKGGQIIPLSPLAPQQGHAKHLAGRARMAGEVKLGEDVMSALNSPGRSELVEWSGTNDSELAGRKNGMYDSRYDDEYYDEDYTPPVTPRELREQAARFKQEVQTGETRYGSGRGIPEIGIRNELDNELDYRGLNGEIRASDIQDMRDAQVAMMRQNGPGRQLIDQVNEVMPRALPQRITVDDLNTRSDSYYGSLDRLPAMERRQRAMEKARREADEQALNFDGRSGNGSANEIMRDNIKDNSLDIDREGASGVAFAQELFNADDVATLRELQRVMAQNGMKSQEISYRDRTPAARRSRFSDNPNLVRPNEPVNFLQVRNADQDARMDQAIALDNRNSREREVLDLVDERFAPDHQGAPRLVHNIYGARSVEELLANNPPSPRQAQLTTDQALSVVARSVHQPGTTDSQDFADGLRVLQAAGGPSAEGDAIVQEVFEELIRQPAGQRVNANFGNINPVDMRNPEYVEQARPPRGRRRPVQQFDDMPGEGFSMEELMGDNPPARRGRTVDSPVANNPAFDDLADAISDESARRRTPITPINRAVERAPMLPPRADRTPNRQRRRPRASEVRQMPTSLEAPPRDVQIRFTSDGRVLESGVGGGLGSALRQQEAMVQQARPPAPRTQSFDTAPAGMNMDQFLEWNDRQNGVERGQRRNPQPNRPRRPETPSWNAAPLVPDTEDIPF